MLCSSDLPSLSLPPSSLSLSLSLSLNRTKEKQPSMAVEARHLSPFPPQLITSRDLLEINEGNTGMYSTQMGSGVPFFGTLPETLLPFPASQVFDPAPVKTSLKADSGVTYNVPVPPRKRSRDSLNHQSQINNLSESSSFLGEEIPLQIHQQQSEIDRIVTEHTKKIRLELEERQNQYAKVLLSAIGEGIAKKMKERDEQIQRMGKMNWVLQERVKSLFVENQLWRDLAQTNEATANSLRNHLNQVLAHVRDERPSAAGRGGGGGDAVEDDAESCCDSCDYGREEKVVAAAGGGGGKKCGNYWGMCRKCGEREARVLLLPCRHLCLCSVCGSTHHHICPVCNAPMNASFHVNMS